MLRWILKYKILLLVCFSISVYPSLSLAKIGNDSKPTFSDFEKRLFDLIDSGIEPLSRLDEKLDEESLYNIALLAEQKLAENSLALSKVKIPAELPADIKLSLEIVKEDLSTGFKALEESINYFAQYLMNRNHLLYDKHIEKRDKGFLYIDGGLTSLTTVRLRLGAPIIIPNDTSKVWKRYFYQLERVIPIKTIPNGERLI